MTQLAGSAVPRTRSERALSHREAGAAAIILVIAVLGFWFSSDLPMGTLRSVGPGMLPRALSVLLGLCAIPLFVAAWRRGANTDGIGVSLRGPLLVISATALFAATIKTSHFGAWNTPEFGLVIAGPLAILVGGYATPEARLRPLLLLALFLTPFSLLLFGDALNLPIPIMPRFLQDHLLAGWGYRGALRLAAGAMLVAGLILLLAGRRGRAASSEGGV
ncbi:tripartite tricarboxylate transporter TctB family protein [Ancylobacter terrae]|uniref:tripartite tricarboxylate transporter TctB family protein n=1 Tax=Ancylobacter sp. sgz301288 TaxID=3342077 RepID=UPI00385CD418